MDEGTKATSIHPESLPSPFKDSNRSATYYESFAIRRSASSESTSIFGRGPDSHWVRLPTI